MLKKKQQKKMGISIFLVAIIFGFKVFVKREEYGIEYCN